MGKLSSDPQQPYATGEPGNVQGRDRVGIVEWSCGYRALGDSIWRKFVSIEKPGVHDEGGRHVAKRSSDPPCSCTQRESQEKFWDGTVWGLQRCPVGTGPAGSVFGVFRLIEKPGVQNERGRQGPLGTGPAVSIFLENSIYR